MTDRASLLWESTSASASIPSDLSANTVQAWKTSAGITGPTDYLNATIYCEGDLACKGTLHATMLKGTNYQISDADAKVDPVKRRGILDGIRKINIYNYHYKGETPEDTTIGAMAQELLVPFAEIVDVPEDGTYMSVNSYGLASIGVGGVKELDKVVQGALDRIKTLETNEFKLISQLNAQDQAMRAQTRAYTTKLNEQNARLRAQDDRMRAQDDRMRAMEERIRAVWTKI